MNETQASLRENLRALPRGAWILFFGTILNKFGTFVLPFLAIHMTRLGYTSAQAGLAIGAYGVGTLCACLLGGYLADRLGRRKTIVLSMGSAPTAASLPLCNRGHENAVDRRTFPPLAPDNQSALANPGAAAHTPAARPARLNWATCPERPTPETGHSVRSDAAAP
jgi:hypothetical protein